MTIEATGGVDEGTVHWNRLTSKNGVDYEVGYLEEQGSLDEEGPKDGMTDFGISVQWAPMSDEVWVDASADVKSRAAITKYSLSSIKDGFYEYKLCFVNTENYHYYFHDETGDEYSVNTYRKGDHFLRYRSKMPTIVYIHGD
jgi:hypothetical protein